ncbi:MAG: DAK2 domain-containing protein [bacterium]|nr:DAK2 domain-containing protein [bacterium]
MIVDVKKQVCDGYLLKWLVAAGLAWLEQHQEQVNQMNVFPVPDGDTGTNMRFTLQKACEAIAPLDEPHAGIVGVQVARGALLGARGNSGVILSQLLRGFAEGIRGHEVFDAQTFAHACQKAVAAAYRAVLQPTEGTILTVAREAVEALLEYTADHNDLTEAFNVLIAAAKAALTKTPELMPLLKEAGVVDSGGSGLVYILEGMQRFLHGEPVNFDPESRLEPREGSGQDADWQNTLEPGSEEGYGYDVQFLMRGENMDVEAVRDAIDAMGWSTLVVGDSSLIKVHVHVHNPGQPLTYAIEYGAMIDDVVVENMQLQYQQYVEQRRAREQRHQREVEGVAVITVASGDGLEHLFYEGLGAARVISGGQTMNPSAEHFLSAIDSLSNTHILLLPNNSNILMAAQQAAELARGKQVQVVPTRTIPQGVAALLATLDLRTEGDVIAVMESMQEAIHQVQTGEITTAIRDVALNDVQVREGQYIGLLNEQLVAAGDDLVHLIRAVLSKARADEHELVTLYYGETVTETQARQMADVLIRDFDGLQFEIVEGGQPLYPYILSIE